MGFLKGAARPLEPDEQALLETVQEAAQGVLAADAATLEVRWVRSVDDGPSWPLFELRPRGEGALPISLALGNDWIDTSLYLDKETVNFELWAGTVEERLRCTAERIEAVISGRAEVELRGRRARTLMGRRRMIWGIVATFETARGRDETSRAPVDPSTWRDIFTTYPADEASGRIGPMSFAPYLQDGDGEPPGVAGGSVR